MISCSDTSLAFQVTDILGEFIEGEITDDTKLGDQHEEIAQEVQCQTGIPAETTPDMTVAQFIENLEDDVPHAPAG